MVEVEEGSRGGGVVTFLAPTYKVNCWLLFLFPRTDFFCRLFCMVTESTSFPSRARHFWSQIYVISKTSCSVFENDQRSLNQEAYIHAGFQQLRASQKEPYTWHTHEHKRWIFKLSWYIMTRNAEIYKGKSTETHHAQSNNCRG